MLGQVVVYCQARRELEHRSDSKRVVFLSESVKYYEPEHSLGFRTPDAEGMNMNQNRTSRVTIAKAYTSAGRDNELEPSSSSGAM